MHRKFTQTLTGTLVLAAAALTAQADSVHRHGTDILHYYTRTAMTNEAVDLSASGRVEIRQNQQGNASKQTLDITVRDLDTNSTFSLWALVGTNAELAQIGDFQTDKKGRAVVRYRELGNGQSLGHGKLPLPAALNPLTDVHGLAIFNSSSQAVLSADVLRPDKLQYLVKRDLSTNNVDATLRIDANSQRAQFRLLATGLNPTNDYLFVINGSIVQTNATNTKGRLSVKMLMPTPADFLDLRSVALWDAASNVVVGTTLP